MRMLMTQAEKERMQKHTLICNRIVELTAEFPNAKPHRVFNKIAQEVGMTMVAVRNIAIKNNLYTTTK